MVGSREDHLHRGRDSRMLEAGHPSSGLQEIPPFRRPSSRRQGFLAIPRGGGESFHILERIGDAPAHGAPRPYGYRLDNRPLPLCFHHFLRRSRHGGGSSRPRHRRRDGGESPEAATRGHRCHRGTRTNHDRARGGEEQEGFSPRTCRAIHRPSHETGGLQ